MNDSQERLVDLSDSIDFRAVASRLWQRRRWIGGSLALCTAAFAAAAFIMTPIYRSATVFVSATVGRTNVSNLLGGALSNLAPLAGININPNPTETEEGLAVLKSRRFTESFIEDKRLMPELFPRKWDRDRQQWRTGVRIPTPAQAYKYFDESIRSVSEDRRTGLITLEIRWRDRIEAAQWANELLSRLNAEMRSRAIDKATASIGYLEKELTATTVVATRDAIGRLMETEINHRMLATVTVEYAFRVVDTALPADQLDVLRPKKLLMIIVGFALGAALGIGGVLMVDGVDRVRLAPNSRA